VSASARSARDSARLALEELGVEQVPGPSGRALVSQEIQEIDVQAGFDAHSDAGRSTFPGISDRV